MPLMMVQNPRNSKTIMTFPLLQSKLQSRNSIPTNQSLSLPKEKETHVYTPSPRYEEKDPQSIKAHNKIPNNATPGLKTRSSSLPLAARAVTTGRLNPTEVGAGISRTTPVIAVAFAGTVTFANCEGTGTTSGDSSDVSAIPAPHVAAGMVPLV
jgi:hypothetical protein